MAPNRSRVAAALLALVLPGAGQLYNRERSKAIALFCMMAGILFGYWFYRSSLFSQGAVLVLQLILMLTACADAYAVADGREPVVDPGRRWSVISGLLVLGPFAIPLLWQSPRFSTVAKWVWSVGVVVFAVLAVFLIGEVGEQLDQYLELLKILESG